MSDPHPQTRESVKRSIYKTLSWRVVATITTVIIVYAITRKVSVSICVGLGDTVIKTVLYYFHERFWAVELPDVGEQ
jgi:adenylylsulfate kinase